MADALQEGLQSILSCDEAAAAVALCDFGDPANDIAVWAFLSALCTNVVDPDSGHRCMSPVRAASHCLPVWRLTLKALENAKSVKHYSSIFERLVSCLHARHNVGPQLSASQVMDYKVIDTDL